MVLIFLNQWCFSIIFIKALSPYKASLSLLRASQVALVLKNPPANVGDIRDAGSIPGLGRSPQGRHGNTLQYSCLENSMGRGTWKATVCGVAQSQTRLKQLITHVIIIHSYFTIVVCLFFLFLLSIYFWYLSLFASLYPLRVNLSYTHCSLFSAISLMSAEKPPDHQSFLYLGKVPTHSPFSQRSLIVTDIWSGFACLFPVCLSSDTMLVT